MFLLLGSGHLNAAPRWKLQYFYDKDQSALEITDLACPSTVRCIASGVIFEKGHGKGVAIVTSDGGEHWSQVELKERPSSLFFLNDSMGWMAAGNGIWRTEESGLSWTRVHKLESIEDLHFVDPMRGFAVGYPKAAYQTEDGGKTWTKIAAADQPDTPRERTVYQSIVFDGPHGFIFGYSGQPRGAHAPDWLDPARAVFRPQTPRTTITLETLDGGKTWRPFTGKSVADLTRLKIGPKGRALGLWTFGESAEYPTEVYRMDLSTYDKVNVYREAGRVVTDLAYLSDGEAFLAAIETPGKLSSAPVPGKLKMLRSSSLKTWIEMVVDYRAVAQRAILAGPDARHLWVATDTGMILKLVEDKR